jgi:hypothetical protein
MADDGFHEIQLNSKQLIFLCMTAALVLVVAFLSGVLVGRGVRTEKDPALGPESVAAAAQGPSDPGVGAPVPAGQAASPPPAIAPPPRLVRACSRELRRLMGSGKMIVEFFSTAISESVCR